MRYLSIVGAIVIVVMSLIVLVSCDSEDEAGAPSGLAEETQELSPPPAEPTVTDPKPTSESTKSPEPTTVQVPESTSTQDTVSVASPKPTSMPEDQCSEQIPTKIPFGPSVAGFGGSVKLNGQDVPSGTKITAMINGVTVTSTTTDGSSYSIKVAGEYDGKCVQFLVGDNNVRAESVLWERGESVTMNLNATSD